MAHRVPVSRFAFPSLSALSLAAALAAPARGASDSASADPLVERGRYLSFVGFGGPWGTVYPANLPSDAETGLGGWTDEQILHAVRHGQRPDGRQLAPAMPRASCSHLDDEDGRALVAYLRSLPPVRHRVRAGGPGRARRVAGDAGGGSAVAVPCVPPVTTVPRRHRELDLEIEPQPDDASCGPTCLQAVYRYFGDEADLDKLIAEVPQLAGGGTLAVHLANHALRRGYQALITTYNLGVFDPSWFEGRRVDLAERLRAQARVKDDPRVAEATGAYLEYLSLGGELQMADLSPALLRRAFEDEIPILTGLSASFLYRSPRETGSDVLVEDDLRGVPTGHFVVLCGWDDESRQVRVADPLRDNPRFQDHLYWLPVDRVINSILLGVLTYDANLLLLDPPERLR